MKKLFSFVLALLLCQGLFALETTLWEDTYVNQVELNNTVVSTFNTGDVLRVYVTIPASGGNFKICYKGPSNNWTETAIPSTNNQWPWINGGDTYYEITFTDADIAAFEGMLIYLYENGNPITKVSLITPDPVVENRTIWTGSQVLDWSANPSQNLFIDAATAGVLNAGDTIIASYSAEASAQLHISMVDLSWGWQSAAGSAVDEGNGSFRLCLTEGMVANMVQGMAFSGINCTITGVDIHVYVANPTIWTGDKDFGTVWGAWEQIAAPAFANAAAGQLLRFKFHDLRAGAQLKVSKSDWNDMPDAEILNLSGRYCDFTITAAMLTELQSDGAIISGLGFSLTEVLLINPADLRPLTAWVPVTDNWVFDARPSVTVHVENPYSDTIAAQVEVEITTDKAVAVDTLVTQLEIPAGGSHDFVFTTENDLPASFYKATCIVNDDLARAFGFAINPTAIVSAPDKQADFDTFWAAAKAQLDAIAINATLTEISAKSTAARKVYLVEMQSVPDGLTGEPVTVRGYYCEPQDGQPHPVIMHYLGYDSGYRPGGQDVKPYCPSGDAEPNYAEFYLSTRGQSINNRAANERETDGKGDFTNTYGDWFAFNFGDKDSYYYRGAYMDCVRAIQFMASRPTSDMNNLFAEGQSQGGAFTYAAAALSGYAFRAIAPAIAFMGDFPDYFELSSWPGYVARENQGTMTDEQMFAFLSYFDTKNLATGISCPVIACIGLQDNVCPPHTNIAPYNNLLSTDKELIFNPENYHQAGNTWYSDYMAFFASRYSQSGSALSMVSSDSKACKVIENGQLFIILNNQKFYTDGTLVR